MRESDWPEVRRIYMEGIATGQATFEVEAPDWRGFDASRLASHRLVAEAPRDGILGWAAVSAVSSRPVYSGVVEHSVYVSAAARGRRIGTLLLQALIASTEEDGIWTIQASVFPENEPSLRLHPAYGFRVVGRREKIARMAQGPAAGQWRDTILIERRTQVP
ncbi:GNAT family N-acetyltransferase [Pseudarthrobacter sp. H3Y2-7]|uniref:GNAT family N-acetyltransferase n=1 Tax=Pseudarthrobacter naphthalenicus TaxID=3031328 RepID=UPI0023B0D3D5|nr:GNAT family N-acetyltransferase [Pseudarthrobacter sp. H3Y2-7]MDE8670219.1 GNAT family N-acetyltransferase [Pseudarthrobacter sp. H3Y2-7]